MDREIKFRGRDAITGEWIYGYFYKSEDGFNKIISKEHGHRLILAGSESQYTGLKDKNGTEIYEGDIVSYQVDKAFEGKEDRTGYVKYKQDCFVIDNGSAIDDAFLNRPDEVDLEVIGNIYETEIETNKG